MKNAAALVSMAGLVFPVALAMVSGCGDSNSPTSVPGRDAATKPDTAQAAPDGTTGKDLPDLPAVDGVAVSRGLDAPALGPELGQVDGLAVEAGEAGAAPRPDAALDAGQPDARMGNDVASEVPLPDLPADVPTGKPDVPPATTDTVAVDAVDAIGVIDLGLDRALGPDAPGPGFDLGAGATVTATFEVGRAQGPVLSGYGWVTLGSADTVTSPTCATTDAPITNANPCAGETSWSSSTGLCVTGAIPALSSTPTASEYAANWGIEVGVNAKDPIGPIGLAFQTIAVNLSGSVPAGLRIELHRAGDPSDITYCANATSGHAVALTSFSTECWSALYGTALAAADAATIDRIGVQISPSLSPITLDGLCLDSVGLGN